MEVSEQGIGIFGHRDVTCSRWQVLHSTEFQDVKMAEGKRVVVVGNGKSAVDCAVEASKAPGRAFQKRKMCKNDLKQ